jgi:hypothetical protein
MELLDSFYPNVYFSQIVLGGCFDRHHFGAVEIYHLIVYSQLWLVALVNSLMEYGTG